MPTTRGTTGARWLRWALALGLGLAGLALNLAPVEILSGVHLLFGHAPVLAAAIFLGPVAGTLAGAIAGSITAVLFGHGFTWAMFVVEGLAVGVLARRLLPTRATALVWALGAVPYLLVLRFAYPVGTAATIAVKTVVESVVSALVLQVIVLAPRLHRALRAWLPPPLRVVRTQTAVRSVVLLAAVLPIVVLATVDVRLLYRQRVAELDRGNREAAIALAAAIDQHVAELRASLTEAARQLDVAPARPRRLLSRPLYESPLAREAAWIEDGRVRLVVGVPRLDGASLTSLAEIPAGPALRMVPAPDGQAPFLLVAAPTRTGEVVASIDPPAMTRLMTVADPDATRFLVLDARDQVLADTGTEPLDPGLRGAIDRASVQGTASYLANPASLRSLRPQATRRVAVAPIESFGIRVVIVRQQRAIQPAVEGEALALLGGLVLAVLVVIATGVALTKVIVDPVQAVSRAASGLEAGRRTARVDPGAGDAPLELKQLAVGFDRMADQLERQLLAIESASRAKDEFLSVASHELKTPLTVLKAQVQLLARRATEAQGDQLKLIDRQLDRITRLVSQLLDASAVGAGLIALDPREMELSEVVRRVAQGLAPSNPGHELHLELEPVTGRWDELRLEQVLHNLIGNAFKYSPAGGPIDATLRKLPDGGAELCIADRGIGIADGQQDRLFERFGRGTSKGIGGFGVGLYVVREIVQRHGGTVELAPREGGGTVATVRLPPEAPASASGAERVTGVAARAADGVAPRPEDPPPA